MSYFPVIFISKTKNPGLKFAHDWKARSSPPSVKPTRTKRNRSRAELCTMAILGDLFSLELSAQFVSAFIATVHGSDEDKWAGLAPRSVLWSFLVVFDFQKINHVSVLNFQRTW